MILFTGWKTWDQIQSEDQVGRDLFGAGNAIKDYHGHNEKRKIYISYGGGNNDGIMSEVDLKRILNEDLDRIVGVYDGVIKKIDSYLIFF